MECRHCDVSYPRREILKHEESCLEALVPCGHCNVKQRKRDLNEHVGQECEAVRVRCKDTCGLLIKRTKIRDHDCVQDLIKKVKSKDAKIARLHLEREIAPDVCNALDGCESCKATSMYSEQATRPLKAIEAAFRNMSAVVIESEMYKQVRHLGALQYPVTQMVQVSLQKRFITLRQLSKDIGYTEFPQYKKSNVLLEAEEEKKE